MSWTSSLPSRQNCSLGWLILSSKRMIHFASNCLRTALTRMWKSCRSLTLHCHHQGFPDSRHYRLWSQSSCSSPLLLNLSEYHLANHNCYSWKNWECGFVLRYWYKGIGFDSVIPLASCCHSHLLSPPMSAVPLLSWLFFSSNSSNRLAPTTVKRHRTTRAHQYRQQYRFSLPLKNSASFSSLLSSS